MKNIRPILILTAFLLSCLFLAACGKNGADEAETSGSSTETVGEAAEETKTAEAGSGPADEEQTSGCVNYIDIYKLDSPAKEAAILLASEMEFSLLEYDGSFFLEKDGTFTDSSGDEREMYIVNFRGEALALVSDVSEKDSSVLFNCINDDKYPFTLYNCFSSTKGWMIDKDNECIPQNYHSGEE